MAFEAFSPSFIYPIIVRQHVNPLSRFFQLPIELPDSHTFYGEDSLPIHLDIGSARGKFLIALAQQNPTWNYLGVEIRKTLVDAAEEERNSLGLNNLKFFFCNANVSLENWLAKLRPQQLQRVTIQFPDPWFKRRHYKRRVLQPSLLISIANALPIGAEIFIQSDVLEVIKPMVSLINISNCFSSKNNNLSGVMNKNPFGSETERETFVLSQKLPIYRFFYIRNCEPVPELFNLEKASESC